MNVPWPDPDAPPPGWFAAYVDGELPAEARARLELFLDDCPAARDVLDGQREFSPGNRSLWHSVAGPEPSADAWHQVLHRIESRLNHRAAALTPSEPAPVPTPRLVPRWRWMAVGLTALTSAAAIVMILLNAPVPPVAPANVLTEVELPWPVASDDDVEITSLHDEDERLLVVGRPPMTEPIVWAAAGDVRLHALQPDEGMMPVLLLQHPDDGPMIVAAPQGGE